MSTKTPRQWFQFTDVAGDASTVEIHIIDFIGGWFDDMINRYYGESIGVTARAFVEQLAALPDAVRTINLHINSPGGDVQGGINIANALRAEQAKGRTVHTHVDGLAASIASVIAMAGSKVFMADNALMMVHDPFSYAVGNATELRKEADVLDTMRGQIIATYQWHSPLEVDALAALMAAETWMTADEAMAHGLATDKVAGLQAVASITPSAAALLRVPEQHRARVQALVAPTRSPEPAPAPAPEAMAPLALVQACAAAGLPALAESLLAANATPAQVEARITEVRAAQDASRQRAEQITAACALARQPELADGYIAGGMPLDQVRAQLVIITAKVDKAEIDGGLLPDQGQRGRGGVDHQAAYRNFNQQH